MRMPHLLPKGWRAGRRPWPARSAGANIWVGQRVGQPPHPSAQPGQRLERQLQQWQHQRQQQDQHQPCSACAQRSVNPREPTRQSATATLRPLACTPCGGPTGPAARASATPATPNSTRPVCWTAWYRRATPWPAQAGAPPRTCVLWWISPSGVKSMPPPLPTAWCTTCWSIAWHACTSPFSSTTAMPTAKARARWPRWTGCSSACARARQGRPGPASAMPCSWTLPTSSTASTGPRCLGCFSTAWCARCAARAWRPMRHARCKPCAAPCCRQRPPRACAAKARPRALPPCHRTSAWQSRSLGVACPLAT